MCTVDENFLSTTSRYVDEDFLSYKPLVDV